jgi:glutamate/tyrosine decarboxylase-like PLP-dependent enzyme
MDDLLHDVTQRSINYLNTIDDRSVAPTAEAVSALDELDMPLPKSATNPADVIRILDEVGSPATMVNAGGRFFGFVNGGALPASVAANWLAGAWDQNAGLATSSPVGQRLEEIALKWVLDVLGFPAECGVGFVTGATMANFTGLAAARHTILKRHGWDVEAHGLYGAPEIKVVVSDEVHVSLLKGLMLLGLGRERVTRVPTDGQGRMRVDALPPLDDHTILCIQAGNVNTGAFDPASEIIPVAHEAGAWVHVDGAFGLWAAAAPNRAHLMAGFAQADSWATDGHKWLNVPYDSGLAIVRDPRAMRETFTSRAAYLLMDDSNREPNEFVPDMSRRARGVEVWAAMLSLGKDGLAEMIEGCCRHATRFAEGLRDAGFEVLNEVVINQVMVSFGEPEHTTRIVSEIQKEGTLWVGTTQWQGRTAMRISVSSWKTSDADVEKSLEAIIRVASGRG